MQNLKPEVPLPFWALMGLCRGLPGKELLRILKLDTVLCNRLLEGCEMNGPSLSLPVVRQRVARALQEEVREGHFWKLRVTSSSITYRVAHASSRLPFPGVLRLESLHRLTASGNLDFHIFPTASSLSHST